MESSADQQTLGGLIKSSLKELPANLLRGGVIGLANIIPGVSGGTMALILGIYERLIDAIHNISLDTVKAVLGVLRFNKEGLRNFTRELQRIDAIFLAVLGIGAFLLIIILARVMTYLLEAWHDPTYGFFFGLVFLSAVAPYKMIRKHGPSTIVAGLIAVAAIIAVSSTVSSDTLIKRAQVKHERELQKKAAAKASATGAPDAKAVKKSRLPITFAVKHDGMKYFFFFLAGAVAISAMILPGVSGSFLMLLMGVYFDILRGITEGDVLLLASFALGCVTGVVVFSRLLSYLLHNFHDLTMAFLMGLVIGSLWLIWPFKHTAMVGGKAVYLTNRLPDALTANEWLTFLTMFAGAILVAWMIWIESRNEAADNKPAQ